MYSMEQVQRGGESSPDYAWTTHTQHTLLWKVHLEDTFTLAKSSVSYLQYQIELLKQDCKQQEKGD